MTAQRLAVLLHGSLAGWLARDDETQAPTFTYTADYQGVALSAHLPVRRTAFTAKQVASYLHGLLPENPHTLQRWAQQLQVAPTDTFGMLAVMGWDCPGAVQFCHFEAVSELAARAGEYRPATTAVIAQRLRHLVEEPSSWTMKHEHWSLGGQQEKFALTWRNEGWNEAHGSAATTHIFKPGIRALNSQALVEHLTMWAASLTGVDVASTRFLPFEDQWAVVVTRFDRQTRDDGAVKRLHQEDFCQALGRLPSAKYEAQGGPTLADMVRLITRESRVPGENQLALADFVIINLVACAPDGHSKNISLLREPGDSWVAPLYDLATGLAYDSNDVDRSVAVSVGGERQVARIHRKQWEKAATTLGIDVDRMVHRVATLATQYPMAFAQALEELQHAPGAHEVERRALPALVRHCDRILAQLS